MSWDYSRKVVPLLAVVRGPCVGVWCPNSVQMIEDDPPQRREPKRHLVDLAQPDALPRAQRDRRSRLSRRPARPARAPSSFALGDVAPLGERRPGPSRSRDLCQADVAKLCPPGSSCGSPPGGRRDVTPPAIPETCPSGEGLR